MRNGKTVWIDNSAPEQFVSFSRDSETERLIFVGNTSDGPYVAFVGEFRDKKYRY